MNKKTWDLPINKHTDWGGDLSTAGLPVKGSRVQEFIKNNLNSKIGYVVDEGGKYKAFTDLESYLEYKRTGDSQLILALWKNDLVGGLPIYTKSIADLLEDVDPSSYIVIPDEDDVTNSNVENKTYDTSINGPLANILFSAIRTLLSEIARLKNSFDYGIHSYTGTNTAMSRIEGEYEDPDEEPLWAIEEDGLSLIQELVIGELHELKPAINVDASTEGILKVNSEGAVFIPDLEEIEDPKLLTYLTTSNKNIIFNLIDNEIEFNLDLSQIETTDLERYNILVLISRKQIVEDSTKGNSYIWISIGNPKTDLTIAEGYYLNGNLYEDFKSVNNNYTINGIEFLNIDISKCKIYSKYQDFSREVIPSKPSDSEYAYKTAHITIRSVDTYYTLESIKDLLPENELTFVEDSRRLYIKNNNNLIPIAGGSAPVDDGMTREETIQLLKDMGIVQDSQGDLSISNLSDITFIHQATGTKFKLLIDENGNIQTTRLPDKTLADRLAAIGREDIGDTFDIRGFIGNLLLDENHITAKNKDGRLNTDRLKIGAFYAPAKTNKVFGCSHCFVELENTSDSDIPLEGCYLHFAERIDGQDVVHHLALIGIIPAGSTYLIRGALKANFDDTNTFIKVTTFDLEWYENGELIDFSHNGEVIQVSDKYIGNDPHGFALTYGNANLKTSDRLWENNSSSASTYKKANFLYHPSYIDSVYYNTTFSFADSAPWTTANKAMSYIKNQEFPDCIYRNTFELDPAKLAYLALNTYDSSRCRHANNADYQYLYLRNEYIEFPKTEEKYPISRFTPKASFEHKNVCTDKSKLDTEKPNMVTCAFGKNPYTTRCFNWVSGGLFDEYVFIKDGNSWTRFQSYTKNEVLSEPQTYPHKVAFDVNIINSVYARMTGRFPGANTLYTSHKCILHIVENSVNAPTTYTYIVGRADKDGNPDFEHCSEEYTFTLYPESYVPRIYQTTDLQGFHWVEYQSWGAAANYINNLINDEVSNNNIIPVLINTGDMTQSGARINEWLDYYNAGKELFKHLEQTNVVGNNDLCGNDFTILGTGDDIGKANSYYFHVFYCYEVETTEGSIPIINNKYVPSLYKIDFTNYRLLMVNSEITYNNCQGWFNTVKDGVVVNAYTGWTVPDNGEAVYVSDFTSIYTMIYNMTNNLGNKELIVFCHEMPFTVITQENLHNNTKGAYRSVSGTSLVGSHLNQLTANDNKSVCWFSRLLEFRNCKLCIGGHKHTYAITYPLMENYKYGNNTSILNGPMTMTSTLENDNCEWIGDNNENLSKLPLSTRTLPDTITQGYFYPTTHVNSFYGNNKGVVYFMCQATGFKLMSNKELPGTFQSFSLFIPESNLTYNSDNEVIESKANANQRYPMFAIFELGKVNNLADTYLIRLANIQKAPATLFTQIDFGTSNILPLYLIPSEESDTWKYGKWTNNKQKLLTI